MAVEVVVVLWPKLVVFTLMVKMVEQVTLNLNGKEKIMKKILIACLVLVYLACSLPCFAGAKIGKDADAAITSGHGYLTSIIINTDGTNAVTVKAYDNASEASGSKLFSDIIIVTSATNRYAILTFAPDECLFANGIYIDVTTSGTVTYDVYFKIK
jgi:hypothetical protein